jgi:hypothetical protein
MNLNTLNDKPHVCRLLRTKTAFGSYLLETDEAGDGQPTWQDGESTTAIFWCLKTMDTCGPDDDFAHAKSCRAGRQCFRADED